MKPPPPLYFHPQYCIIAFLEVNTTFAFTHQKYINAYLQSILNTEIVRKKVVYLKFKVAISIIMIYFRLVRWCEKVTAFYDVEEIPLPALASPEALDDCGGVFA